MMLCCPTCGRNQFGHTDRKVIERLQAASEPLTAAELLKGINIAPSAWVSVRKRLIEKLEPLGYRLTNATKKRGGNGHFARYRLEKIED